jgi:hypothetical protein
MDVLNKLNFATFREPSIIAELNIPLEKLEKEMHIRKPIMGRFYVVMMQFAPYFLEFLF